VHDGSGRRARHRSGISRRASRLLGPAKVAAIEG
jgi:hypothetical protein